LFLNSKEDIPHITWCATGPLAFLPLHAAGIYDHKDPSQTIRASDFIVSSYTPSLSALIRSSAKPSQLSARTCQDPSPRILVVSQSATPGQNPLPCTTEEAEKISRHFPNDSTRLADSNATVDAVLKAMQKHEWVHLACHGTQDPRAPTESAFLLEDGRLALSRLMDTSLPRAELAVLSACQTAKGDEGLPEEAVHLAAGMLAAGFQSVVATMWSINDADGPILSDAFYAALKRHRATRRDGDPPRVAHALHEAVECLKVSAGEENFARWVPFVHFGV
jgi:CHAT domain-containing protein